MLSLKRAVRKVSAATKSERWSHVFALRAPNVGNRPGKVCVIALAGGKLTPTLLVFCSAEVVGIEALPQPTAAIEVRGTSVPLLMYKSRDVKPPFQIRLLTQVSKVFAGRRKPLLCIVETVAVALAATSKQWTLEELVL